MTPCFLPLPQPVVDLAVALSALLPLEMAAPEVQAVVAEELPLPLRQQALPVPAILHQPHPAKVITAVQVCLILAVAEPVVAVRLL
jgi:hypothetical protein